MSGKRNWGKERMDGHEPPPVIDTSLGRPPSKVWKKKYECKRGKGKHDWSPFEIKGVSWDSITNDGHYVSCGDFTRLTEYNNPIEVSYWVTWKCEACGKQDWEHYPHPEKKYDLYRYKLYAK